MVYCCVLAAVAVVRPVRMIQIQKKSLHPMNLEHLKSRIELSNDYSPPMGPTRLKVVEVVRNLLTINSTRLHAN
jgi:hypothetical protein